MDNLRRLLRDVLLIAQHRYDGDLTIARENKLWSVTFRERNKNGAEGFTRVQVGEGPTLEAALRATYEGELGKARRELDRGHELIRSLGLKT